MQLEIFLPEMAKFPKFLTAEILFSIIALNFLSILDFVKLNAFTFKHSNYHQNAKRWDILIIKSASGFPPLTYKCGSLSMGLDRLAYKSGPKSNFRNEITPKSPSKDENGRV